VNKELDAFSHSVAHDLRAPLRAVDGYALVLEESHAGGLDAEGRRLLGVVRASSQLMGRLIDALLDFARLGRQPLRTRSVELDELVNQTIDELRSGLGGRTVDFVIGKLGTAVVDPALLKQVLANLLGNAVKFTRDKNPAVVEIGRRKEAETGDANVYYVKDNGAGFDMRYSDKLFGVFQRLHRAEEYEEPAWAFQSSNGSSPATAAGSGPTRGPAKARRSISRSSPIPETSGRGSARRSVFPRSRDSEIIRQ